MTIPAAGANTTRPSPEGAARRLILPGEVVERIRSHGHAAYPHECCGALLGRGEVVCEALALPNSTAEGPRRRFLVRPADYRDAEDRARARGSDLVGFYHSHPDHPARPSRHDLDHAWPYFAYVILAVSNGEAAELTAWQLRDDRSAFETMRVIVDAGGRNGS